MLYIGSEYHKKVIKITDMYRNCWLVNKLNVKIFEYYNCQKELLSIYRKALVKINEAAQFISEFLSELEKEKNKKLRLHVETLVNAKLEEFYKLYNDIYTYIENLEKQIKKEN